MAEIETQSAEEPFPNIKLAKTWSVDCEDSFEQDELLSTNENLSFDDLFGGRQQVDLDKPEPFVSGIACDIAENVLVVDTWNNCVKMFDPDGNLKQEYTSELVNPWDVAFLKNGHLAVANGDGDIKIFGTKDEIVEIFGQPLLKPCGIDVNSKGDVIVSDIGTKTVYVLNKDGDLKFKIKGKPIFKQPLYVAVNKLNDNIIVSDLEGDCIQVFDQEGDFQFIYGPPDTCDNKLANTSSKITQHVPLLSNTANSFFLTTGPELESDPNSNDATKTENKTLALNQPKGVCSDKFGRIFISDSKNDRIQVLDPQGQFMGCIQQKEDNLEQPQSLVVTKSGDLLVSSGKPAYTHIVWFYGLDNAV